MQAVTSQDVPRYSTAEAAISKEERRRTGRYLAGGVALGLILVTVHHIIGRSTSATPNVWTPAIIMGCYLIWVLHAAHKDREKAIRLASAMSLDSRVNTNPNIRQVVNNNPTDVTRPINSSNIV